MDSTPQLNDSGYVTSSSSTREKRKFQLPSYESTPSSSKPKSRKRKSSAESSSISGRKLSDIIEKSPFLNYRTLMFESLDDSLFSPEAKLHNSTTNNSFYNINSVNKPSDDLKLSSSLEKCTLEDVICESHAMPKKYKWDNEELECRRKSNSAPGTPNRYEHESETYLRKYCSLDLTPTKGIQTKIGTPERFEILYPKLVEVKPASRPKNEIKKFKLARKRLFQSRDFVYLFTNVKKVDHVIKQIFSYLNDTDLVNVAKVSNLWKKTLENNMDAFKRYKAHVKKITISKENIYCSTPEANQTPGNSFIRKKNNIQATRVCRSPPTSPGKECWKKFTKMAAQLNSSQRLKKCVICTHPAVFERGIAKCSRSSCGYLWCTKCLSGSKVPEDLICYCLGPRSPPSPTDRNALADKSNFDASLSYYFMDNSQNATASTASGYFSSSDVEKSFCGKSNSKVLTDCNKNVTVSKRLSVSRDSNDSILEHSVAIQRAKKNLSMRKEIEPGSPQKIKMHSAGSKQSKRNLRRLCL